MARALSIPPDAVDDSCEGEDQQTQLDFEEFQRWINDLDKPSHPVEPKPKKTFEPAPDSCPVCLKPKLLCSLAYKKHIFPRILYRQKKVSSDNCDNWIWVAYSQPALQECVPSFCPHPPSHRHLAHASKGTCSTMIAELRAKLAARKAALANSHVLCPQLIGFAIAIGMRGIHRLETNKRQ